MDTTLFRWIHLSDIHVGHGDAEHGWDQKAVMGALREDIAAQVKKDQAPIDAILVTGDIAFSGNGRRQTEYEEAKAWLVGLAGDAGVDPRQIFVVPGNHDVNRAADNDRNTRRLLEGLRSGRDQLDGVLGDKGDRELLASRMAAYLTFAKDFAPVTLADEGLFWVHRMAARGGLSVRLIGLNTALLAKDDEDQGKLYLGRKQLTTTLLDRIEEGELVMVLSHHPLQNGWLADERDADAWLRNRSHVHLSGHVHEAESQFAQSGGGGAFVRLVAGSVHGEKLPAGVPASHGYSFGAAVQVDHQLKARVWPRKWSPRNASFRVDADNVPDGEKHADHDLRVKLSKEPSQASVSTLGPAAITKAPDPTLSAESPTEIFISYAPEDEPYLKEIEKRLKTLKRDKLITSWSAAQVGVGEDVKHLADAHLRSAKVILLLMSPDYLSSDDLYDGELQIAVKRHEQGQARIVPILVRACDYTRAPFARLRMVPPFPGHPEKPEPVTSYGDKDTAYLQIQQAIAAAVQSVRKGNVGQ